MPNPYSNDIRERVISHLESGSSRREVAEHFEISVSAALKWAQRLRDTGSFAAKPRGGSESPLEEHKGAILAVVYEHRDLTLDEYVVVLGNRGIAVSRSAFYRFLKVPEASPNYLQKNTAREFTWIVARTAVKNRVSAGSDSPVRRVGCTGLVQAPPVARRHQKFTAIELFRSLDAHWSFHQIVP